MIERSYRPKACGECGEPFQPTGPNSRLCSNCRPTSAAQRREEKAERLKRRIEARRREAELEAKIQGEINGELLGTLVNRMREIEARVEVLEWEQGGGEEKLRACAAKQFRRTGATRTEVGEVDGEE